MKMDPLISVILPTAGRRIGLMATLRCLGRQTLPPDQFEVIVVDNTETGQLGATLARLSENCGLPLRYCHQPRQGKSHAMASGISMAKGAFIACTDDDCLPRNNWLEVMLTVFQKAPRQVYCLVGKVLPLCEGLVGYGILSGQGFRKKVYGRWFHRAWVGVIGNGSNVMYSARVFREMGGFLTWLGPGTPFGSGEETEFFYRILRNRRRILFVPDSVVFHDLSRPGEEIRRLEKSTHLALGAMYAHHLMRGDVLSGVLFLVRLVYTAAMSVCMGFIKACSPAWEPPFRYRRDCIHAFFRGFQQYLFKG